MPRRAHLILLEIPLHIIRRGNSRAVCFHAEARQSAYRELFRYHLDPGLVDQLRSVTNGNYALGNESFLKETAKGAWPACGARHGGAATGAAR